MAEIELEFYDAANVLLNPHEIDTEDEHLPTILHFEPCHFEGPVVSAEGQTTKQLGISVSDPTNTVSLNSSASRTKPFVVEGSFDIHGVEEEDPPSKIHWVIRENGIKERGIRPEFSVAVIVGYTPGRRFAAKVRVNADVVIPLAPFQFVVKPVAGAKDDPLYFEAREEVLVKDTSLPRDLKPFTRLEEVGGTWLKC